MTKLSEYISNELNERGWSLRELGRRSGFSHPYISAILSGQRTNPSADFCIAVARALGKDPVNILRLADILPPLPPPVKEEGEAMSLFRSLGPKSRELALATLRALAGQERGSALPASAIGESPSTYQAPPETDEGEEDDRPKTFRERMAFYLWKEMQDLEPEDQQRVIDLMERLSGNYRPPKASPLVESNP